MVASNPGLSVHIKLKSLPMYNKQPLHASPVMTTQTPLLMMLMHMHSAHKENKSGGTTTQETLCSQTMLTLQAVTSCQDDARYNPSTSIHGTPNKKDQATTCVCVSTRRHVIRPPTKLPSALKRIQSQSAQTNGNNEARRKLPTQVHKQHQLEEASKLPGMNNRQSTSRK